MIETVKGFRDVLPPESLKRQKAREVIEKNFKLFGFVPIETPSIEYEDFARGENEQDEAVSDRFKLTDKGNREISLRYELTFQLKRVFKENPNIRLPFKRYQIAYVFRDEPIERDRYREFIQCDADIIGDASIKADAECLALVNKICKELGVKYTLKINNRKLLNSILKKVGISDIANTLREIDKIDKLGEDEVKKNLTKYADKNQIIALMKLLKSEIDFFAKENFEGAEELLELQRLCKIYTIPTIFSPSLVRGLSYYTGNIFEGHSEKIKGSLFGGGRYDAYVGKYLNREIPAIGISLGRLLDYPDIKAETTKALIVSINQDKKAIQLATELRNSSISCIVLDKVSKGLEFANSQSIPFVIFIGEDEVKKKKFKLRDMKSGKESFLSEESLVKVLA